MHTRRKLYGIRTQMLCTAEYARKNLASTQEQCNCGFGHDSPIAAEDACYTLCIHCYIYAESRQKAAAIMAAFRNVL